MSAPDAPQIRYLDGPRLRRAVVAGARHVMRGQRHLDEINVFPVPDSDTGTNMAATMRAVAEEASQAGSPSVAEVSELIADSALMSAKGNSGAILAQFFTGLAEGLQGRLRVTTDAFAEATAQAAQWAADAIQHPREGTILTVIRAWSEAVAQAKERTSDFRELMTDSLERARTALQKTPEQMEVLKKAGVVDAGAQGFVYLLEGVVEFIRQGHLRDTEADLAEEAAPTTLTHIADAPDDLTFRYCTECLITGDALDRGALQTMLAGHGDSLVVAGSPRKVRVHIHTDAPRGVFDALRETGTVTQEKVDDMKLQQRDAHATNRPAVAIVVDTACDLPEYLLEQHHIHPVPLRVHFGEEEYIDHLTIQSEEFFQKIQTHPSHPTTSQPTPADLKRTYDLVLRLYEAAVAIHVTSRHSGTYQSSVRAAERTSAQIAVVDGRTGSAGLGLLALAAAEAAESGADRDAIVRRVEEARANERTFIALDTMTYAIRGGRVAPWKGVLGRLLNLKPVLSLDDEGYVFNAAKALGPAQLRQKTLALVDAHARGKSRLRFAVAHGNAPDAAAWYVEQLTERYAPDLIYSAPLSPALGAHAGPGAVIVSILAE